MKVVCHTRGEGDIIDAFVRHYLALGADHLHFIVHGSDRENARTLALPQRYPCTIEHRYDGAFRSHTKQQLLNELCGRFAGQWLLVVDADEFVELPYDLRTCIRLMERHGALALRAPLLQRITHDGSLPVDEVVADPMLRFPFCSRDLYEHMGVEATLDKYPLFLASRTTRVRDGGNHVPPAGIRTLSAGIQGVSHHFKWRGAVMGRLEARREGVDFDCRHESEGFEAYLRRSGGWLPLRDAFPYSRRVLFEKGLMWQTEPRLAADPSLAGLRGAARRGGGRLLRALFDRLPDDLF